MKAGKIMQVKSFGVDLDAIDNHSRKFIPQPNSKTICRESIAERNEIEQNDVVIAFQIAKGLPC